MLCICSPYMQYIRTQTHNKLIVCSTFVLCLQHAMLYDIFFFIKNFTFFSLLKIFKKSFYFLLLLCLGLSFFYDAWIFLWNEVKILWFDWVLMLFCLVWRYLNVKALVWRHLNIKALVWRHLNLKPLMWMHLNLETLVWRHLNLKSSNVKTTEP